GHRWRHWGRDDPRRRCGSASGPPGRHRAARPGVRLDGPVPGLRRPRRGLCRRGARAARGPGVTALQPGRARRAAAPATPGGRRSGGPDSGGGDGSGPVVRGPAVLSYYLVGGATLLLLAIGVV